MDCKATRANLVFFLDGELGVETVSRIRSHVDSCSPCRERADFERNFSQAFRERARGVAAPEHLRERLRFALARAGQPSLATRIASSPSARWAMAAALVVAVSLSIAQSIVHEEGALHSLLTPAVRDDEIRGTFVCLGCESQKGHAPVFHEHQNVIRTGDGSLWTIIESPASHEMIRSERWIGQRATVRGTYFHRTHAVSIESVRTI